MSTTSMQRPFLVGHALASHASVAHDFVRRDLTHKGLYLVSASGNQKPLVARQPDIYKLAAVAAALFLALTI